jgi:hypothetical protein
MEINGGQTQLILEIYLINAQKKIRTTFYDLTKSYSAVRLS